MPRGSSVHPALEAASHDVMVLRPVDEVEAPIEIGMYVRGIGWDLKQCGLVSNQGMRRLGSMLNFEVS
jgi:hypothetical protein